VRRVVVALLVAGPGVAAGGVLAAQERTEGSAAVFQRFADRVVKLQVVESGSGAKSSLGTGFFVAGDGRLISNYHVIAETVADTRYRLEWLERDGTAHPARVVAIDVVRDLAVVATDRVRERFFALGAPDIARGTRLYSLGHPEDLGLSIVEGTYNGLLEHTLYPKIHFTGPLNPGMSGGPSLTADGQVVGVNVATAGNSLSFLVPVEAAVGLLERSGEEDPEAFEDQIAAQVLANQDRYLKTLFQGTDSSLTIGPFALPTQPAAFFRCWADADRDEDALYEFVDHRCSTDDYIYLSGSQSSGIVSMTHRVLVSRGLSPLRFYALYTGQFRQATFDGGFEFESGDNLTDYRCRDDNVRRDGLVMRVSFCVRRYRKYRGLYDARIKAAVLGARDAGVVTQLNLSGVSFENAEQLARQYLDRIRWAKR
jgi:serine protease Do